MNQTAEQTHAQAREFVIEGRIAFEQCEGEQQSLAPQVVAFDRVGVALGTAKLDEKGQFKMALRLKAPSDLELVVGPGDDAANVRQSSGFVHPIAAKDWRQEGRVFVARPQLSIARLIWWPWRPVRICISGHVRKLQTEGDNTHICPVPYVKVELFDVDREACFWPLIRDRWDTLLDRPLVRLPELLQLRQPPQPWPGPDPSPQLRPAPQLALGDGLARVAINPQPEPPGLSSSPLSSAMLARSAEQPANGRVGEARLMDSTMAARLERLTISSRLAPWLVFPRCFYSRQLVCETYTDCDGYFHCCFNWWPLHLRRGRLRFDARPDVIVRVTQVINGVSTVVYLDPYTSTRWNTSSTHIDLYLDNEEVRCGQGCHPTPEGVGTFFTRIGDDEVHRIDQGSGLYAEGGSTQMAYGGRLSLFAAFGDALADGAPKRYYRLSYAPTGSPASAFKYIDAELTDTRVDKSSWESTDHFLGPQPVGGSTTLYEVRNRSDFYWYSPDRIGSWWTPPVQEDSGKYTLRLELFDENGAYLNSASGQVDYRDGTVAPPAVLPAMVDHCDLVLTLDNRPPVPELTIPAVTNACGVIPWSPALSLNFQVSVTQDNHRLQSWRLQYTKGVNPAITVLAAGSSSSGALSPVNQSVSGTPLLVGLDGTCAFALKLYAWAHIRNGYGLVYYREQIQAIAVEKCAPCPVCTTVTQAQAPF